MDLLTLIGTLIVIGLVLWVVNNYIPMEARIKNILNIVVIALTALWVLRVTGVLDSLPNPRVGP